MLGIDENTAVTLGVEVAAADKLPAADASTTALVAASTAPLLAPASKAVAPVVKKKAAKKVHVSAKARKVVKGAKRFVAGGGWRKARVSWYGPGFYGHGMAGGGKLTKTSMIVAHRSLPFGTKIQFQYKGRTCTAVVKDRGPFVGGREFDLGPGTAKALGFSGVGTVQYKIIR